MKNPGRDSVVFVSIGLTDTKTDRGNRTKAEAPTTQAGCSMQPWSVSDKVSDTVYAQATNKCICPVSDVTLACKPEDRLEFNSHKYRVIGTELWIRRGVKHHVTVFCQEQR